jgi:hypothetical protein
MTGMPFIAYCSINTRKVGALILGIGFDKKAYVFEISIERTVVVKSFILLFYEKCLY